jgi:hypothetical protein
MANVLSTDKQIDIGALVPKQTKLKVGRPKLPKGQAKGRIVPVRFSIDEVNLISAAAKARNLKISEWIRSTLKAATA